MKDVMPYTLIKKEIDKANIGICAEGHLKYCPPLLFKEEEGMAFVSHFFQHRGTVYEEAYREQAENILQNAGFFNLNKEYIIQENFPFHAPKNPDFTFIDLFAGVGGFRLALQKNGGRCIFSSEWDPAAQQTYFKNYGDYPFGDITKRENKNAIPKQFDVLCAGFPCQPFSLAGKKQGFENKTQGTLFFDIMQIVHSRKPKVIFLENVRNLVSHNNGNTFKIIREAIENEGYSFQSAIIDASPLVPQKRVRCYMVGVKGGVKFNFPVIEGEELPLKSVLESNVDKNYTISDAMWSGHQRRTQRNLDRGTGFTAFTADLNKPAHTLVARYYKDGKECLVPQEGKNPRMLTPRECARLQGFPETFILPSSKTAAYKQMGNSVAVPVLERIGHEIVRQLLTHGEK